jgi:hypothetical protein
MVVLVLRVEYLQARRQSLEVTSPLVAVTVKVVALLLPIRAVRAVVDTAPLSPAWVLPVRATLEGHPIQPTTEAVEAVQAQSVRLALVLPVVRVVQVLSHT